MQILSDKTVGEPAQLLIHLLRIATRRNFLQLVLLTCMRPICVVVLQIKEKPEAWPRVE